MNEFPGKRTDPLEAPSVAKYLEDIYSAGGVLHVPYYKLSYGEAEWEFWVGKLHNKFMSSFPEDLETIKKIAERL